MQCKHRIVRIIKLHLWHFLAKQATAPKSITIKILPMYYCHLINQFVCVSRVKKENNVLVIMLQAIKYWKSTCEHLQNPEPSCSKSFLIVRLSFFSIFIFLYRQGRSTLSWENISEHFGNKELTTYRSHSKSLSLV